MKDIKKLEKIAKLVRYWILLSTTQAGSGHPTSSLSAVELMVALLFGGKFRFNLKDINQPNNDRLIFSKGHAAPLLYALFAAAGAIKEKDLLTLRKFGSPLEGHPTPCFPFVEAATGSLGQGLSIGLGLALNAKIDKLPYFVYVLLGDSEMSEGSCWEAIQLASHYRLDNLVGIIDVNRLGQRGETMYGHKIKEYQKRISAFGWQTYLIEDGHNFSEILSVLNEVGKIKGKPTMIIAKTIKGKGVSFLEDKEGWHGKALKKEELEKALVELGEVDKEIKGEIKMPENFNPQALNSKEISNIKFSFPNYQKGDLVATRKAYGIALAKLGAKNFQVVALDGEVKNSTFAEIFEQYFPQRYFEMFIAEQNMLGTALGLAIRGKIPFVSTFAAFLSRAYDQIRMAQYSREKANIKFVGSHAGVSIGQDGPSQMGLEDIAFFRTLRGSCVLYPADAVSTEKLVFEMAKYKGLAYLRTTRPETPVIYSQKEKFKIGGSKVLKESKNDKITLVGAGITLFEILKSEEELKKAGISARVIDCYSIKPLDKSTLLKAGRETGKILVVEDHYPEGGLAEAIKSELSEFKIPVYSLAVRKIPISGKPDELLDFEEISSKAIIKKVKEILKNETRKSKN